MTFWQAFSTYLTIIIVAGSMTSFWWLLAYGAALAIIVLFMRGVKIVNHQADAEDAPDVPLADARHG